MAVERAIPSSAEVETLIRSVDPDVVVVSPFLIGGSPQTDTVKSAQALGVPAMVCVANWDNLTNKGHMRVMPDRVVVWNEDQRREAVELHDVPEDRIDVTGAQPFDRWFGLGRRSSERLRRAKVERVADVEEAAEKGSRLLDPERVG